ncbi:hypothetical protein, partial [Leucobacter celer]|uniref:hypothetical protein n=1 Tax=Leucobacter celer TaxID=668625 RepID=UPI000AFAEA31
LTGGFYGFSFRACSGGVRGASTEAVAYVGDPGEIFRPRGPAEPGFEVAAGGTRCWPPYFVSLASYS